MPYRLQYGLSVFVAVALAIIGALQLSDPAKLGLSPIVIEWTKVVVPGLGILAGVLPSLRRPPDQERNSLD